MVHDQRAAGSMTVRSVVRQVAQRPAKAQSTQAIGIRTARKEPRKRISCLDRAEDRDLALLPVRIGTCDSSAPGVEGSRGVTNEYQGAAPQNEDIIRDARWFPEHFDAQSGGLSFVATDADVLASQTFLDTRWDRGPAERRRVNAASMTDRLPQELPRPNFIWHTGFCCSTLLAKALDRPGHNLSLCEPQILVEVADAKRAGALARSSQSARVPQLIFHLLGRGFAPG